LAGVTHPAERFARISPLFSHPAFFLGWNVAGNHLAIEAGLGLLSGQNVPRRVQ